MAAGPAGTQPIIIIKKKGGHGGHHGGAWKVAYADFVTAMMALFIVLWLLNSSKQVQEAVGGYFKDPNGVGKKVGTDYAGVGPTVSLKKEELEQLKEKLEAALKKSPKFEKLKDQVMITITPEGLRVELLESDKGSFFESGRTAPTPLGGELITKLAQELSTMTNKLLIEGHTDARPYSTAGGYSNWELSADRANAARRLMQEHGVRADQVRQVRGFADQSLRDTAHPEAASNRRISILVQSEDLPPGATLEPEEAGGGKKDAHGKPVDSHGKPVDSHAKPADSHAKPADSHAKPASKGH